MMVGTSQGQGCTGLANTRRRQMAFSIDQTVADCVEAIQDSGGHPGAAVQEVLAKAVSDPAAIEAAMGKPQDQPMLTPWLHTDELTVLHIVWPPEVDLVAHNHLMWASIGLYGGQEENRLFRALPDGSLEQRKTKMLRRGDTVLLGSDTIHAVSTPSREWTGAIHVYGGDFFEDGKSMWPLPEQAAAPYDIDVVRKTLDDAATRALALEAAE
jgi:predicted metal-dependent enzyme (double-stranded beta helix superfamily)